MIATTPVAVGAFLIILATSAVVLRFVSRKKSGARLWYDDWLCLAALPFCITIDLSFWIAAYHGFGQHGGDPTFFEHVLYFDEVWYNIAITLTKLSVLCFYYRIFSVSTTLKISLWVVGVFCVAWLIAFTAASILQCIPIEKYWHRKMSGTCVYQYGFFLGQAIPNIVLDFTLLVLPLVPLWKLHMQTHQKWALIVVFILGYTNPLISVLRIVAFINLGPNTGRDTNYSFIGPALWSAAEVSVAVFSCSIPSLTYLFRKAVGFFVPSLKNNSKTASNHIEGVKPPTFGSTPSTDQKRRRTASFEMLDNGFSNSDCELNIFGPRPSHVVLAGVELDGVRGESNSSSLSVSGIRVRNEYDVRFENDAVKADTVV